MLMKVKNAASEIRNASIIDEDDLLLDARENMTG